MSEEEQARDWVRNIFSAGGTGMFAHEPTATVEPVEAPQPPPSAPIIHGQAKQPKPPSMREAQSLDNGNSWLGSLFSNFN